jgi:hypothetical protein
MEKKTVVSIPKLFKKDRAAAIVMAAKREALEEYRRLRARDKSTLKAKKR